MTLRKTRTREECLPDARLQLNKKSFKLQTSREKEHIERDHLNGWRNKFGTDIMEPKPINEEEAAVCVLCRNEVKVLHQVGKI
jgi:hypothetical protein